MLPLGEYAVGTGLINSYIVKTEGEEEYEMLTLPPRYRTHEAAITKVYELAAVRDIGLVKGFKSMFQWVCGSKPASSAA